MRILGDFYEQKTRVFPTIVPKEKLQYDTLSQIFERVFTFYGDYYKSLFISDASLLMNDKKSSKVLGNIFAMYFGNYLNGRFRAEFGMTEFVVHDFD